MNDFASNDSSLPVVLVREAKKSFGGKNVLSSLSMTVERGHIYSLLGASGCGKSTALKCILGLSSVEGGVVLVFGRKPGEKGVEVPGKRVGYMPQDYALHSIFSIEETLKYYGTLFGMNRKEVEGKIESLTNLLNIPDKHRRIGTLSGGQQRRVSLAVALIHSPELLILDEPTVGVDPLLRERIWQHLKETVTESMTTVIITTHYIEEARHSNMIGMMRNGKIISEDSPLALMKKYNVNFLEKIVIEICRMDERRVSQVSISEKKTSLCDEYLHYDTDVLNHLFKNLEEGKGKLQKVKGKLQKLKALTMKNLFTVWRNIFIFVFIALSPLLMMTITCLTFGTDPTQPLNLGLVNLEPIQNLTKSGNLTCDLSNLSEKYLNEIPKNKIKIRTFQNEENALKAVENGEIWGYVLIPKEFTVHFSIHFLKGNTKEEWNFSLINYRFDMTNFLISEYLRDTIEAAFRLFLKTIQSSCGLAPLKAENFVERAGKIYGKAGTEFVTYVVPSHIIIFAMFFPFCSSSVQYIADKKNGTAERARAAGVQLSEIMTSYFITEGANVLFQIFSMNAILSFAFGVENHGSFAQSFFVAFLVGVSGIVGGFFLSTICSEEAEAGIISSSSFFVLYALSGSLWPLEGMTNWLQVLCKLIPQTLPAESLRSIMNKGWGLTHDRVWPGMVSSLSWIVLFSGLTFLCHWRNLKKK